MPHQTVANPPDYIEAQWRVTPAEMIANDDKEWRLQLYYALRRRALGIDPSDD